MILYFRSGCFLLHYYCFGYLPKKNIFSLFYFRNYLLCFHILFSLPYYSLYYDFVHEITFHLLHGADIQHNQDKPSCSLSYHRLHTLRIIIRCYSINTRTDTHVNNTICHDVNIPRTLAPPHIKRRLGARVTRQAKIRDHVSLSVIPNLTRIPRFQFKIFSSSAFSFSPTFVFLILPLPFFFLFLKDPPLPQPLPTYDPEAPSQKPTDPWY